MQGLGTYRLALRLSEGGETCCDSPALFFSFLRRRLFFVFRPFIDPDRDPTDNSSDSVTIPCCSLNESLKVKKTTKYLLSNKMSTKQIPFISTNEYSVFYVESKRDKEYKPLNHRPSTILLLCRFLHRLFVIVLNNIIIFNGTC